MLGLVLLTTLAFLAALATARLPGQRAPASAMRAGAPAAKESAAKESAAEPEEKGQAEPAAPTDDAAPTAAPSERPRALAPRAGPTSIAPPQSAAELLVATSVVLNAILGGVTYALGLSDRLTRGWLAAGVVATSCGLLGLYAKREGRSPKPLLRAWRDVALLPLRAAWATVRAGAFTTVGLLFAAWFLVWTALAVYYAPNWRDWDCLWYHESMVGFTIQNHGFAIVDLPVYLQKINGYQRFGEMSQLWFGIWAGRPLVEAANLFYTPMLMGSVYLLTRRYSRDRVTAVAWAVAFLLVPGNARLLQSTMVDPHAAALFVTATFYASEKDLTPRNVWLAIVALTMAIGAKTFLLIPGFVLALLILARLVANRKALGGRTTLATVLGGSALLIGMVLFTHLRNYLHFKNPVWPDLTVDLPSLGIHWQGQAPLFDPNLPTTQRVNANVGLEALYDKVVALPWTNTWGDHSWQIADYGPGVSWFLAPIGVLVCVVPFFVILRDLVWKYLRKKPIDENRARRTRLVVLLTLPTLVAFAASPALYIGRYHTAMVGVLTGVVAWVGSHYRFRKFAEGVPLALQLTAIMATLWTPASRRYWLTADQMKAIVRTPYPEREVAERFGAGVHEATGREREREIHAGDVVGFDDLNFVSLLWNNHYSNRVVWLDETSDRVAKADALGCKWIYAGSRGPMAARLAADPRWVLVGPLEAERFGVIYRRR